MGVAVSARVDVRSRVQVRVRVTVRVRRRRQVARRAVQRCAGRAAVHARDEGEKLRLRAPRRRRRRQHRCRGEQVRGEHVRDECFVRLERAATGGAVAPLAHERRRATEAGRRRWGWRSREVLGVRGRVRRGVRVRRRVLVRRGGTGKGAELRRELREEVCVVEEEGRVERVLLERWLRRRGEERCVRVGRERCWGRRGSVPGAEMMGVGAVDVLRQAVVLGVRRRVEAGTLVVQVRVAAAAVDLLTSGRVRASQLCATSSARRGRRETLDARCPGSSSRRGRAAAPRARPAPRSPAPTLPRRPRPPQTPPPPYRPAQLRSSRRAARRGAPSLAAAARGPPARRS